MVQVALYCRLWRGVDIGSGRQPSNTIGDASDRAKTKATFDMVSFFLFFFFPIYWNRTIAAVLELELELERLDL